MQSEMDEEMDFGMGPGHSIGTTRMDTDVDDEEMA